MDHGGSSARGLEYRDVGDDVEVVVLKGVLEWSISFFVKRRRWWTAIKRVIIQ